MAAEVIPFSSGGGPLDCRMPVGFRSLPCNIDAEQAILGAILVNNLTYTSVSKILTAEHFYEPVHRRIYAAFKRLIDAGIRADYVTIHEAFEEDEDLRDLDRGLYLARLARSAEAILVADDYAKVVVDCWVKRSIIMIAEQAVTMAFDPSAAEFAEEQLQIIRGDLDNLAQHIPASEPPQPIDQIVVGIIDRLRGQERATARAYFSTGLKMLDGSMNGGLHRGEVYSFEARPEQFKTGLMGTIALNLIKQGVPILYCALEMGAARIVERMIASDAKLNSREFRSGIGSERLIDGAVRFLDGVVDAKAWWQSEPGMSFDRLRGICNDCVNGHQVKVIFIDYWQLVGGLRKGENKAQHLETVAQWMEQFALKRDVVIMSASQTNRDDAGLWGDGLFRASSWQKRLHKIDWHDIAFGDIEALWLEHIKDRHAERRNIGDARAPALYISKQGPVARDWGDW